MKAIRMMAPARGLLAVVALWAVPMLVPATASAQETREEKTVTEKRVVVEVRDGKVFVNGKESEIGEEGQVILRKGDDDEMIVIVRKDGPLWVGAPHVAARARVEAERARDLARSMARFRTPDGDVEHFYMQFDPQLPDFEEFEVDIDVENELAKAFENVQWMRGDGLRLRRQSEELRELESQIRERARELRRAEEADRAAEEARLDELLQKAFEMKLQEEQKQVEELQQRLSELQHRLQERQTNRREIIDRRRKDLLGRRDNLDW